MSTEPLPHLEMFAEAAVSQRVHLLEAALRTVLFRRTASRAAASSAG